MGKLTSKGKHTVKVGNHPHTNLISKLVIMRGGEYKCRIFEMHLKLRDQQLKTIMYTYRLLYQNLMLTTNENSIIDINTKKEKGGASLAAQWLRICLPMQGTRVQALVWEDSTCRGATRPVSHNC